MVILFVLLEKLIQIPLNNIFLHKVRIFKFKFITEAKDFCVFFDGQYKKESEDSFFIENF